MTVENFEQLLVEAKAQPIPQRLLFVFTSAELPDDASADQRAGFFAGEGGALLPFMMVDRAPDEMAGFAALAQEAALFAKDWHVVFVAALSGRRPIDLSAAVVDAALNTMVERIRHGDLKDYLPLDREGRAISLI